MGPVDTLLKTKGNLREIRENKRAAFQMGLHASDRSARHGGKTKGPPRCSIALDFSEMLR